MSNEPIKPTPGLEAGMRPPPKSFMENYKSGNKLEGKVALISGADSGIGRAVAIGFAKEGADVAILYLNEQEDAEATVAEVVKTGQRCIAIKGDLGSKTFCNKAVEQAIEKFGKLDILVNNAAEQHAEMDVTKISESQLRRIFETNVFGAFFLTQAALAHLKRGDCIINTASITAYQNISNLVDYSATKGALVAFTRSLSGNLARKGIRVNAVAPGSVWTPMVANSLDSLSLARFGRDAPMGRAAQPDEVAPCFIFLASKDSSYMTGQVLHPNGGVMVGS